MYKKPLSSEKIEEHKAAQARMSFPSRFQFLKAHNGIRPDGLHGLGGVMGSGKSTLFQEIIADTAEHGPVHIQLSEEPQAQYQSKISDINPYILKNLTFLEEREIPINISKNHVDFCAYSAEAVLSSGAQAWFIDNATTGKWYDCSLSNQSYTAKFLFDFTKRHRIPVFYLCHWKQQITKNFIRLTTPEDTRGSNVLPMRTEFFYCLNTFEWGTEVYNVLETAKHRGYEKAKGTYVLNWRNGRYRDDVRVDFDRVKEIFKNRNKL